ncbi:MAG: DoxX family membrane protein [Flavobacteriales bacterium]
MIHKIRIVLSILLGVFFIYKGIGKLSNNNLKQIDKELVQEYIIENNSYAPPVGYKIVMNTFKQSGYLTLISIFQIIAGILIILPFTRFAGLLLLLPIIFNIFFMHVFFDNRIGENVVTGLILALNIFLVSFYHKNIKKIIFDLNK